MALVIPVEAFCRVTLIELLFFLLPVLISGLLWNSVFRFMGSWGALPSCVLGFGGWVVLWVILHRTLSRKSAIRGRRAK